MRTAITFVLLAPLAAVAVIAFNMNFRGHYVYCFGDCLSMEAFRNFLLPFVVLTAKFWAYPLGASILWALARAGYQRLAVGPGRGTDRQRGEDGTRF